MTRRFRVIGPNSVAGGKSDVTVAMLLSHQAGLTGFRDQVSIEALYDCETAATQLAGQEPFWQPGTAAGYHAMSIGFLASALCRRVDGRGLREFVAQELAPLNISIGLSTDKTRRAAMMIAPPTMGSDAFLREATPAQLAALVNPPLDPLVPNSAAWRAAEIPSANGFATARDLARLYGALAGDGILDGRRLVGLDYSYSGDNAAI